MPSSTKSTSGSIATAGYQVRKRSATAQWVVAGRPSSSPAAARTKAPVQMDTIRAPGRIAARASPTAGGSSRERRERSNGGSSTVSAVARTSGPCPTVTEKSALVATGPPSTEQVRTS